MILVSVLPYFRITFLQDILDTNKQKNMPKRFKTYYDEDEDEDVEFVVFIIHGHSKELHKLERYKFTPPKLLE